MSEVASRDVKLALSYVDDAERQFESVRHDDNQFTVAHAAQEILKGDMARAEASLRKAAGAGEDVSAARVRLVKAQAEMITRVSFLMEELKPLPSHRATWRFWSDQAIAKNKELVDLAPIPPYCYGYGVALYFGDRYREALDALRMAEKSDDDEVSLQATKLITQIEERLAKAPARPVHTVPASAAYDSVDVILTTVGSKKIQVIKAIRELTSLGLAEAKNFVDAAPVKVREGIAWAEAEEIRTKLSAQGAEVDLVPAGTMPCRTVADVKKESASGGGCFIATACYGTYDHPDVLVFRRFRDQRLLPSRLGRMAVALYYAVSPPVAARVARMPWVSEGVRRVVLEPLAQRLRRRR